MSRYILFLLAIAGIAGAAQLSSTASKVLPVIPPPAPPAVKPDDRAIAAAGLIEAVHENTAIGAPAAALVKAVEVRVWDKVAAGQVLFRLDDTELLAAYRTARAAVATEEAGVRLAEAERAKLQKSLAKWESIADPRAVSADELARLRDEADIADARVAAARARLEASRARIMELDALRERLVVRAPIAGTILQLNTRPGEFLSPSAPKPPLVLGDIDTLQLRCDIDEQVAPRMKAGLPAVAYLKGDTAKGIPLEFVRIEPFVVPKQSLTGSSVERVDTRVLQVIYRFAKPVDRAVYVGQQMDVYIGEKTIPAGAK